MFEEALERLKRELLRNYEMDFILDLPTKRPILIYRSSVEVENPKKLERFLQRKRCLEDFLRGVDLLLARRPDEELERRLQMAEKALYEREIEISLLNRDLSLVYIVSKYFYYKKSFPHLRLIAYIQGGKEQFSLNLSQSLFLPLSNISIALSKVLLNELKDALIELETQIFRRCSI